jgi:O-antigen ligase
MSNLGALFRNASRWLFLGALVYAPWAYGCTTVRTIRGLNWILTAVLGLWGLAEASRQILSVIRRRRGRRRRRPDSQQLTTTNSTAAPWALIVPAALLLLLGWWMTLNARWIYDSDFLLFVTRPGLIGVGPASVDYMNSMAWMIRATLLLSVMFLATILSRDPVWLIRLWWTIALTGGSIALLGLAQKATGAAMIFWESVESPLPTFFATYYAHGNAGAYLNLVFPFSAALALRGFLRNASHVGRAVALVTCLLVMVAIVSNTSRGGQAIGLMLMFGLIVCFRDLIFSRARGVEKKTLLVAVAVVGFAVLAIAGVSRLDRSLGRWQRFEQSVSNDGRWLASQAAFRAIADAGSLGFGPGAFRVVFPYYTNGLGSGVGGVWRFLHQDYLQTLIEWGWIGSAAWASLFFGSIWTGIRTLRDRELSGRQRLFLTASVLAVAGVSLHALVDFPLQIASLQLYVATYVGVCWRIGREAR